MRTIENVIFDMGGVLMTFEPEKYASYHTTSPADAKLVADALFLTPEWWQLDAGAMGEETAERCCAERLPERLHGALHETLAHWDENREPIEAMNDLAMRLKHAGLGLYLLSNAGVRFSRLGKSLPIYPYLDGYVVSAYEHVVKPDPAIYEILCTRYDLDPESCLFVDDVQRNIEGAAIAGMQGYRFDGDEPALERFLAERDVRL